MKGNPDPQELQALIEAAAAAQTALAEMHERHANTALHFSTRVVAQLQTIDAAQMAKLSPTELARWADLAIQIERQARDDLRRLADDRVAQLTDPDDLTPLLKSLDG